MSKAERAAFEPLTGGRACASACARSWCGGVVRRRPLSSSSLLAARLASIVRRLVRHAGHPLLIQLRAVHPCAVVRAFGVWAWPCSPAADALPRWAGTRLCLQFLDPHEFPTITSLVTRRGRWRQLWLFVHPRTLGHTVTSPEHTLQEVERLLL